MARQMIALSLIVGASLVASPPARALPDFVPKPSGIYERYSALKEPRTDLPVGALWVQGYGGVGEGAAADNLVTVKSLTGVAINRDLQLGLTAGILNLFGIDPSYKSRVSARFADLTIVKVKDPAKLAGPVGEMRIVEALKAGTITISTDSDVGLDLNSNQGFGALPVVGRADTGRRKSWTIDGRDMFIAFRVATLRMVDGDEENLPLRAEEETARAEFDNHGILIDIGRHKQCGCTTASSPAGGTPCTSQPTRVALVKSGSAGTEPAWMPLPPGDESVLLLDLPVPKADGKGGLFTAIRVRPRMELTSKTAKDGQCVVRLGAKSRVIASYEGTRLETLDEPKAPGW